MKLTINKKNRVVFNSFVIEILSIFVSFIKKIAKSPFTAKCRVFCSYNS